MISTVTSAEQIAAIAPNSDLCLGQPMQSNGAYDNHCQPQQNAGDFLSQSLRKMAAEIALAAEQFTGPFQIVDYGCSSGGNSMRLLASAIERLRNHSPLRSVQVFRCDLPSNDFNSLANHVSNRSNPARGYYESMVASSFNRQILPGATIHLGTCSLALHWLEENGGVQANGIHPEFSPAESKLTKVWKDQIADFLRYRANEFIRGGKLAICHLTRGRHETQLHGPLRLIDDAIQILRFSEFDQSQIPIYRPTFNELQITIQRASGNHWTVDHARELHLANPIFSQFERTKDEAWLAEGYVNFIQAFCRPTLEKSLSHLGEDCRKWILDRLFRTMKQQVIRHPYDYEPKNTYSIIELTRR